MIHDFTAGAGGDQQVLTEWFENSVGPGDPFQLGWARLIQDGADTVLRFLIQGSPNYYDLARLEGVQASSLVAENLGGYTPVLGPPIPVAPSDYERTLAGTVGANTLNGDGRDELIQGLDGNDTLNGLGGKDRFVFGPGDGANTLYDFQDGVDRLDITGHGGYTRIAQLEAGAKVFFADGGYVILGGFNMANLSDADFIGLGPPIPAEAPKDDWLF